MKSNMKEIGKLLARFDKIYFQTISSYQKNGEEKSKSKYEKKFDRAEQLCRKALALCREDIANASVSVESLIHCLYRLSVILVIRGREAEAEPLLADVFEKRQDYRRMFLLTECMGLYGGILCESGRYDLAATVLSEFLVDLQSRISEGIYPEGIVPGDTEAVCRGLGDAACAFTYSNLEEGFRSEQFTLPVELLQKIAEHGGSVGSDNVKKAAYFSASQQLFLTCHETVPGADVRKTVEYAAMCVNSCGGNGKYDLYFPAAMRLTALALARDCKFADAAEMCRLTLEQCAEFRGEVTKAPFGSIQSIAGDMNLLLGILHYRASKISECIRYFEAAIASFEADAQGRPMREVGYAEVETDLLFVSDAEKCAFACKFIGLAKFSGSNGRGASGNHGQEGALLPAGRFRRLPYHRADVRESRRQRVRGAVRRAEQEPGDGRAHGSA